MLKAKNERDTYYLLQLKINKSEVSINVIYFKFFEPNI